MYERQYSDEYTALAPRYIEMFERLSNNPTLKKLFYDMTHFESPREQRYFTELMEETDEDAALWGERERGYRQAKGDYEDEQEEARIKELRANLTLGDLIKVTVSNEGELEIALQEDASWILYGHFGTGIFHTRVDVIRDSDNTIQNVLLFGGGNGATHRIISVDDKTGKLALGDSMHNVRYDSENDIVIGMLGASEYPLDALGRIIGDKEAASISHNSDASERAQQIRRITCLRSTSGTKQKQDLQKLIKYAQQ